MSRPCAVAKGHRKPPTENKRLSLLTRDQNSLNSEPNPMPDDLNKLSAAPPADDARTKALGTVCFAALNSVPGGALSVDRLRGICHGTAVATGEADVEPIDFGCNALALAAQADWEVVCRTSRPQNRRFWV
jgi:hypothetical protein